MMKYLVGIQPTGKIHIGNYLGCIKKGIELQGQGHDVTFLIANYHSMTTDNFCDETEKELRQLGCKTIKRQTPEYTELFFKICCKMNLGPLQKMPQYKEKKDDVEYDLGLLLYPALMAADIIMNDPDVVIVGKDQVPHLELTNDIAKRVGGRKYKYEFGEIDKVMSLKEPTKKMSKSLGEKHVLYLFEDDYFAKIKKANCNEEGLENLRMIAKAIGVDPDAFPLNLELKEAMADRMEKLFTPMTTESRLDRLKRTFRMDVGTRVWTGNGYPFNIEKIELNGNDDLLLYHPHGHKYSATSVMLRDQIPDGMLYHP
jgi:tryptophanyl-tRNA synthetase